jgi:hypothetical protein
MGAGKSECARRLALYSLIPVVEVAFAAKLKESAAALLDCTVEDLERWKNDSAAIVRVGNSRKEIPLSQTVRSLLQRYGTEAHRDVFGRDFWLDAALPWGGIDGRDRHYDDALYVVTDVRFANEAQRVRDLGGMVVLVVGPNDDTGSHVSEQPIPCDYTLNNLVRTDEFRALDGQLRDILCVELGRSMVA